MSTHQTVRRYCLSLFWVRGDKTPAGTIRSWYFDIKVKASTRSAVQWQRFLQAAYCTKNDNIIMMIVPDSNMKLKDGDRCKVLGGTHAGKSGTVIDIKTSNTGAVTITVVPPNGERFKTLAKNVEIKK